VGSRRCSARIPFWLTGEAQCVSRILLSALFGSTASLEHDVVIDREDIRKRKKKASKKFRDAYAALD
jgi:hypothetical protein